MIGIEKLRLFFGKMLVLISVAEYPCENNKCGKTDKQQPSDLDE
jgi:hypothetical protein